MTIASARGRRTSCVILVALGMVGCASGTVATSKSRLDEATRAIEQARQSTAPRDAPADLKLAEDKLARARAAAAQSNHDEAARWAELLESGARLDVAVSPRLNAFRGAEEPEGTLVDLKLAGQQAAFV